MTEVLMQIDDTNKNIMFGCKNHAGDKDVCIMCSTLCNVLIAACDRANVESVQTGDALVRIIAYDTDPNLVETFYIVKDVFDEIAEQFPDSINIL